MKKKATTTILLLCFIIGFSQSDTSYYEILRNEPLNTNNLNLGLNFRSHFSYDNVSIGPDLTANYRYKRYGKIEISILQALADKNTGEYWNGSFQAASENKRHNELYAGTTFYFMKKDDEKTKNITIDVSGDLDGKTTYTYTSIPFLAQRMYGVNFGMGQFGSRIINISELLSGYEISKPDSLIESFEWATVSHVKYQFIKVGFHITKLEDMKLKVNNKIVRNFARKKETSINLLLAFNNKIDNTIERPLNTNDVFQYDFTENSSFRPFGIELKWSVESLQLSGANGRLFFRTGIAPGYNKLHQNFFMELGGGITLSKKI